MATVSDADREKAIDTLIGLGWTPPASATLDPEPYVGRRTHQRYASHPRLNEFRDFDPRPGYVQDRAAYEPEHPAHSGYEFGGAYARAAALAAGDPDWMNATGGKPDAEALRERIARVIGEFVTHAPVGSLEGVNGDYWLREADAVLAVLPSRETGCQHGGPVRIKGLREQNVVCDLCDRIIGYLPSGSLLSRESVAPTREQVLDLLNSPQHAPMATHDGRTGECLACPVPLYELGPDAVVDAVLALFPGESREAVVAKARAEGHREGFHTALADFSSGAYISGSAFEAVEIVKRQARAEVIDYIRSSGATRLADALGEHFGIGDDRGE